MNITEVDCTSFFDRLNPRERTRDKIVLGLTEHTYFPDGESRTGWLPKVCRAFQHLGCPSSNGFHGWETVCLVGCGPALDGILAVELLRPKRLILTDLHKDVVTIGQGNVLNNCRQPGSVRVEGYVSDLCDVLIQEDIKVDLIYENLPNLPASEDVNVGEGALSASFFATSEDQRRIVPPKYDRYMLGLHYRCLMQASQCLRPGGAVISCIGGRIPQSVILGMFKDLGYRPSVLVVDLVEQFEAEKVLAEYARIERSTPGLEFQFYDLIQGQEGMRDLVQRGLRGEELADGLSKLRIGFNAETAAQRHAAGARVAVVGLVIRGSLS